MRFRHRPDPIYCHRCGMALVNQEKHHDFDPMTGRARRVTRWLECSHGHYRGCYTTKDAISDPSVQSPASLVANGSDV